jgi:hypothetical protein
MCLREAELRAMGNFVRHPEGIDAERVMASSLSCRLLVQQRTQLVSLRTVKEAATGVFKAD